MAETRLETKRELRGFRKIDSATTRSIAKLVSRYMQAKGQTAAEFAVTASVPYRTIWWLLSDEPRISHADFLKIKLWASRVTK